MKLPMSAFSLTIGILALQGAYDVHAAMVQRLGANSRLIRRPDQLQKLDGLILPGGESTTFLKHLERDGFFVALASFVEDRPTFGTCAGCILLAKDVTNPPQRSLGVLDVTIERNAYGRQNDSAIVSTSTTLPGGPLEAVFIRAPRIERVGPQVKVLAQRENSPVLVEQAHLLAATFHPELSTDDRIHRHFLDLALHYKESRSA